MVLLQNIWWFLVLISVMIVMHELGHYVVARLFDVKVETFSIGFGPRLFGFRRGETDFRFSIFLFGGYVKMTGEQPGEETTDPRALSSKPRWQRMAVTFAGPATNVVLAIALLTGLFMVEYPKAPMPHSPEIGYVMPDGAAAKAGIQEGDHIVQIDGISDPTWEDITLKVVSDAHQPMDVWVNRDGERLHYTLTPDYDDKQGIGYAGWEQAASVEVAGYVPGNDTAERAGLRKGDIFVSVDGRPIRSTSNLRDAIDNSKGKPVNLVYSRNGHRTEVSVTPAREELDGQERYMIGVQLEPYLQMVKLPFPQAVAQSWKWNVDNATLIFKTLEGIVERRMSPKSLSGPIGIAKLSGDAAREGAAPFISLMAAISLNLAVVNLLPIPVLDGGGILLLLVEMVMRRDLDLRVKEAVVRAGLVVLMMILVFAIYNDLAKILPPG